MEKNLIAIRAPITLSTMFSTTSADHATPITENEFEPKTLTAAMDVIIVSATTDSATPLAATPTRTRETDRIEFAYEPIIRTKSNTSPETRVEGRRYGAGDGTIKNTTPQTAPIMVALHFLRVCSTTVVMRMPRRKCSGYPTCVMKETMPDEMMYSAENSPTIARAREEEVGSKDEFEKSRLNDTRLTFVLSVKSCLSIYGNNKTFDYLSLRMSFFGLEFNIRETGSIRLFAPSFDLERD